MIIEGKINIKTPEYVSLQFEIAGLGSRAAAFIIDQLILSIVNLIILFISILGMDLGGPLLFSEQSLWLLAIVIIILFIINYGYFFVAEYFFNGRTIGKKAIGIRVIQENGHSVTLLSCFIRNLLRIVDALGSYLVGILLIFLHPKHKRLGDIVAGTIVIHERGNKRNKATPIEKLIMNRGLRKDSIPMDDTSIQLLGNKEWDLLKAYSVKLPELEIHQRIEFTKKLATILLPKIGMEVGNKKARELEDILLVLYLNMREDWEFEI